MTRWQVPVAALVVALTSVAWLDPHARTREANRLFAAGQYDEAASKYNDALVDHPDSSLLHFNLGDAQYKQGKYDDAIAAFEQVHPGESDQTAAGARAAYNVGNAKYRLAESVASTDPKAALDRYAAALVAYRRAIVAAPDDVDAKLNYELTAKKRAELQKKLEEQQQQQQGQDQQQQQQQQQQGGDQQKDQQQQGGDQQQQQQQQGGDQQQPDNGGSDQAAASPAPQPQASPAAGEQQQAGNDGRQEQPKQAEQQQGAQPSEQQGGAHGEQQRAEGEGAASGDTGEQREGEMTRQEATALLDAQRAQEVPPGEVVRRLQGAVVAEPAQDW